MKIVIGDLTFDVIDWDPLEASSTTALGQFNDSTQEIKVRSDLKPEQFRNTLLHEILHGCFRNASLNHEASICDKEELIVDVLTNRLCMVFTQNPHLKDELFLQ